MEPVRDALQEHSEFVMRGGRAEGKAPVTSVAGCSPVARLPFPRRDGRLAGVKELELHFVNR